MKATDLLRQQHREVEELFRQIQSAEDEEERASLREELANALAAHSAIEEEIFYPAAMEALGPGGRIREAFEEHAIADFALYRFMHVSPSDESFAAKLGALKDVVMNHVEEEESELLPQAEGEIERDQLEMLGERLAARFDERLLEGHAAILERSLGITARQAAQAAPGAKKAAAQRRAQPKRAAKAARGGAAGAKRNAAAGSKRGAAPAQAAQKRNGGAAQKRGAAQKQAARKMAGTQKSTPARGQGVSRTQTGMGRGQTGARAGQTSAQQKGAPRAAQSRAGAAGARKSRAGR